MNANPIFLKPPSPALLTGRAERLRARGPCVGETCQVSGMLGRVFAVDEEARTARLWVGKAVVSARWEDLASVEEW